MSGEPVLAEARDGVLEITLNRPEARNAVNAAVAEGVAAALDRLDGDDELRASGRLSVISRTPSRASARTGSPLMRRTA